MADTTKRTVETVFTGKDQLSAVLSTIGKGSEKANNNLAGMIRSIAGLAAGYASISYMQNLGKGIMDVGQKAEQAKISLAGILSGQGMAKDFNAGLTMASDTLKKIEKDAAALPGTAQEFQMAFQTSAAAIGTSGMKLKEFIEFSNKMTATAKIFGEDSAQAGRDISLLVEGRAGMDVTLWSKLAPYMGMAVSDAAKFNKLIPEKRMEKLMSVVGDGVKNQGKLGDMIKAYGDTWDAISSTIDSSMDVLWRTGTAPLFEKAKQNAKVLGDWLGEHEDTLKMLATGAGEFAAKMLTPTAAIGMAGSILGKVAFGFGPVGMLLSAFGAKAAFGGKSIGELGDTALHAVDKLVKFGGVLFEKLGPALEDFAGNVVQLLIDLGPSLADGLTLLSEGLVGAAETLGWFISSKKDPNNPGFLPKSEAMAKAMADEKFGEGEHGMAVNALSRIGAYGTMLLGGGQEYDDDIKVILEQMKHREDALDYQKYMKTGDFGEAASGAVQWQYAMSQKMQRNATASQMEDLAGQQFAKDNGYEVAQYDAEMVMGRYRQIVEAMQEAGTDTTRGVELAQQASDYAATMMSDSLYGIFMNAPELLTSQGILDAAMEGILAEEDAAYDAMMSGTSDAAAEQKVPKKPTINQDFRHSRFDIRQEFPDGTDPDRVAVAFRRDISDQAIRKLGSSTLGGIMGI